MAARVSVFAFVSFLASPQVVVSAQQCPLPPSASNYESYNFTSGIWYEIGKIQTAGGAIFQSGCVCTTLTVAPANDGYPGDANSLDSCRDKTPAGPYINATSLLTNATTPGHWNDETFFPGIPGVNFTVWYMGDGTAASFDCSVSIFGMNYCVHLLSRTPTMDANTFASLVSQANALGLNPQGLPANKTLQAGCW